MSGPLLVTESGDNAALLAWILDDEVRSEGLQIFPAGIRSSADSFARSALSHRGGPVVLVIDADTSDSGRIEEDRAHLSYALRVGGPADGRAHVALISPTIEALLFQDLEVLRGVLTVDIDAADQLRARFEPREALSQLMRRAPAGAPKTQADVIHALERQSPVAARAHPEVQAIIEFLRPRAERRRAQ